MDLVKAGHGHEAVARIAFYETAGNASLVAYGDDFTALEIIKEPKGPERRNDGKIKLHGDSDGIEHIEFKGHYVNGGNKYDAIVEVCCEDKVIEVMDLNKKFKGIGVMMKVKTEGEEIKEKCPVVGPLDRGGKLFIGVEPTSV